MTPILTGMLALILVVWSADLFVKGSAGLAFRLRMPPLLVGMVVVGFGTSAPELLVSALAAKSGNSGLALGNAYGSNIFNIAFVLGLTALVRPLTVRSSVLRRELPVLLGVTGLSAVLLWDGTIGTPDARILLAVFGGLLVWTIRIGVRSLADPLGSEVQRTLPGEGRSLAREATGMVFGLVLLIGSSRALVWAGTDLAQRLGVSDLVIGLTILAVGTSLPELASSIAAALRGEHDLAVGNVIGSNLFNTLAVVGLSGAIRTLEATPALFRRDLPAMMATTALLLLFGMGFRGPGRINRLEGALLLAAYVAYVAWILAGAASGQVL